MEDVYLENVRQQASSTTKERVYGRYVPQGKVLHLTAVAIYDEDSTPTIFRLFIERGGSIVYLANYVHATGVNDAYISGNWYLPEGCRPGIEIYGALSGDDVSVTFDGVYL